MKARFQRALALLLVLVLTLGCIRGVPAAGFHPGRIRRAAG